jgi:two-component system response regulator TctD
MLTVGNLTLDRSARIACLSGSRLALRRREWAVLEGLVTRTGKVVRRERLEGEVFGFDDIVGTNALEVYIGRLRRKLQPDGPKIQTIRGVGYLLEA